MNLAVDTLLLFFLFISPGLAFRRFYYSGVFSKQYFKSTPFEVFISSILPGVLFQIIFCWLIIETGHSVDFKTIAQLFNGDKKDFEQSVLTIRDNIEGVIKYQIALYAFILVVAKICKTSVRFFKLDRTYRLLRFQNIWHYILRGEVLDFPENKGRGSSKDIFLTLVDAAVNTGHKTILYSGFLENYYLTKEGVGVEFIHLRDVKRRDIDKISGKHFDGNEYDIHGDTLIIPFRSIINFNITYITRVEEDRALGNNSVIRLLKKLKNWKFEF